VCSVDAWYAPLWVVMCVMWMPGMHRSVWLCVLCGCLVCTDLSGYVFYVDAWYAFGIGTLKMDLLLL
jgi:hypothetical protein